MNRVNTKIMQDAILDVLGDVSNLDGYCSNPKYSGTKKLLIGFLILILFALVFWLGQQSKLNLDDVDINDVDTNGIDNQSVSKQLDPNLRKQESASEGQNGSISVSEPIKDTNFLDQAQIEKKASVSLVDRMLGNERWDNNGVWSMQRLMKLWKVEYSLFSDGKPCQFAAKYGLICKKMNGNWQQLRSFNRPGILRFSAGLQGDFWGTLSEINGAEATLHFGDNDVKLGLDELSTLWTGEYQLLWQAPQGYQVDLKLGDRGDAVVWLTEKMNQLTNSKLAKSNIFDLALQQAISDYQRRRNITADGIAGMETILNINSETLDGIPLLRKE